MAIRIGLGPSLGSHRNSYRQDEKSSAAPCPGDVIKDYFNGKMTRINSKSGKIAVKIDWLKKKGLTINWLTPLFHLAGGAGVEPTFTESESVVLPLNDSPARD